MVRAEGLGFSHGWTFDSHVLWQEPYVIYPRILERTSRMVVGPMVTNPGTRDWTVIASLHATLDEQFGHRTICGIGRGDSAVRVQGRPPTTLARLEAAIGVIRDLAAGRSVDLGGTQVQIPWVAPGVPELPVWMAGYGPKALDLVGRCADGFILQLADPYLVEWTVKTVRSAAEAAGRDPAAITICVAAPAYVGDDLAHARDQCRWFGGMVGNHVADLVTRYGAESAAVPAELTGYIKGREGYDYSHHGRAGNRSTDFVPDEVVDRFCLLGPPSAQLDRLAGLRALGVDQFAIYAMHDAREATIEAYGESVIPALQPVITGSARRRPHVAASRQRTGTARIRGSGGGTASARAPRRADHRASPGTAAMSRSGSAGRGSPRAASRFAVARSTRTWNACSRSTRGRRTRSTSAVAASTAAGSTRRPPCSGPTRRFAASAASTIAKLMPLPPTGEMTWAASPISSRPGSLQRSSCVIRIGRSVSWLTSVSRSTRSPSHGARLRSTARSGSAPASRIAAERAGGDREPDLPAAALREEGEVVAGLRHQLEARERRVVVAAGQRDPGDVDAGAQLRGRQRRQLPHLRVAPVAADDEIGVEPSPLAVLRVADTHDAARVVAQQVGDPRAHPHVEPVGPGPLDHPRQEPGLRHERVEGELGARVAVVGEHVALLGRAPDERVGPNVRDVGQERLGDAEPVEVVEHGRREGVAPEPAVEVAARLQQRHVDTRPRQEVRQHHSPGPTAHDHAGRSLIHNLDDRDI